MSNLLATGLWAQAVGFRGWGLTEILITIVIIAACIALVYIAVRKFGIAIPAWVVQVFWIVVVACVVIAAIRFLTTM